MAQIDEQPAARRPDVTPHGHGLRLDHWNPDSQAHADAWLRGRTDLDFLRWNTPLQPDIDLAGARAALLRQREQVAAGSCAPFRIADEESGTTLGHIGINMIDRVSRSARVGYWVLPEARGRRVATHALTLAARWTFTELGLYRLELGHALGHEASCRIAQTCGFPYEGDAAGRDVRGGPAARVPGRPPARPPRLGPGTVPGLIHVRGGAIDHDHRPWPPTHPHPKHPKHPKHPTHPMPPTGTSPPMWTSSSPAPTTSSTPARTCTPSI